MKVAVIDDERDMRNSITQWLSLSGYETESFASAKDALAGIGTNYPGIIVSDIKMPGMNGLDAAKVISEEGLAAVILLTAFSQQDLIKEAGNAGVLAYLVKPFQRSDLVPSIELALSRFKEISGLKEEAQMLRESLETRKLIDRAKGLLVDNYGLKESDAYRYLQKKAMGDRTTMRAIAEGILEDTSNFDMDSSKKMDNKL